MRTQRNRPNWLAEDAKKIKSSATHLLQLINDILDHSKIEAGKLELYVAEYHQWKAAVMAGEIQLEDIDVQDHKRLAVTDVIGAGGRRLSQAQSTGQRGTEKSGGGSRFSS